VLWDDLVDDLRSLTFAKINNTRWDDDDESDTGSTKSEHSETSRYKVTSLERQAVRGLDNRRCFVTNTYSHGSEVARILDNSNAGNRALVSALPSAGG
jgi:hypothetical protein